ncbi:aldehyde dehydrogenase family protein, partial [Dactylosporangium sp. NPDC005572]|uniref:aldehyde dehydrogenase family protein n=1 Tax=Dactylosporangium sp. NPDC005572 TaxID=3156889 RepID=UPI0033B9E757
AARPHAERAALLRECAAALRPHAGDLARLLTREQGKPLVQAAAEVGLAVDWFDLTADLTLDPEIVEDGPVHVTVARMPHGPVAAIAPNNFPVILAVTKVAPALLAGNTVVLKPSPVTPLTTRYLGEILGGVLPAGVLTVLTGGPALGPALTADPRIRLVSFTGSVETGRAIAAAVAPRLARVVLELGGNDACVVLPGADLDAVAPAVYAAAMRNTGQFCAAIKRVYAHREQASALAGALAELAAKAVVGDGLDPASELGPLTVPAQRDTVARMVAQASAAGARVLTGGAALDRPGSFYAPTVVGDLPPGTELELEEQFGPVIPVIAVDGVEEAVRRANGTRYGLGGSVWGDPDEARAVAGRLECGTAWVNTHGELRADVPFGGHRSSGLGVEYGYWGLLEYTRITVCHERRTPGSSAAAPEG